MFYNLKNKIRRQQFATRCKGILETSPLKVDPTSNTAVLSQLQHKDVILYLIAMKSFADQVNIGSIYVLNDGSLTTADIDLLKEHVPTISILELDDFYSRSCPRGGTWERLLAIAELVKKHYVIQLDSDTLTVAPVNEVIDCIKHKTAFTLGTWDNQNIETMQERCIDVKKKYPALDEDAHVQFITETNFDKLNNSSSLKYVRGCSGFAGFPNDSFSRNFVEQISKEIESIIGKRWHKWGSEQVMSNIVVANIERANVLPHPKYSNCNRMKYEDTAFIHFIGSCRFNGGIYADLARKKINSFLGDKPKTAIQSL